MARKVNTSKEKRRTKRGDRLDYTSITMAKLRSVDEQAKRDRQAIQNQTPITGGTDVQ